MRTVGAIIFVLMAGGCTTAPDGSTLGPQESAEHQKCIGQFGYQFGTPGYGECRMQLAQIRNEENDALGRSFQRMQQMTAPPPAPPRFSTTCTTFGATTTCN